MGFVDVWPVVCERKRGVEGNAKVFGLNKINIKLLLTKRGITGKSKLWEERLRIDFEYVYFERLIRYPEEDVK